MLEFEVLSRLHCLQRENTHVRELHLNGSRRWAVWRVPSPNVFRNSCATVAARATDTEPCLVVDLEAVRDNYQTFAKALPAQPRVLRVGGRLILRPKVPSLLASMGLPRVAEIEMALAAGATPDRVSYGNTIKKERDLARAFALGIRLFAVESAAEVEKIARRWGATALCRILYDCAGAEWPLSRKFGCDPEMAVEALRPRQASGPGAVRHPLPCRLAAAQGEGVGSCPVRWPRRCSVTCAERGYDPSMVNRAAASRPSTSRTFLPVVQSAGRLPRCASISATRSRKRSSSRAAAWSEMPASSRPKSS